MSNRWKTFFAVSFSLLALIAAGGALYIAADAAWTSYQRGQVKRQAQNQTKIQREHLLQRAYASYTDGK